MTFYYFEILTIYIQCFKYKHFISPRGYLVSEESINIEILSFNTILKNLLSCCVITHVWDKVALYTHNISSYYNINRITILSPTCRKCKSLSASKSETCTPSESEKISETTLLPQLFPESSMPNSSVTACLYSVFIISKRSIKIKSDF